MKRLNIQRSFHIPSNKTNTSDKLFNDAFKDTWVLDAYRKA
jgi:hypothetical protein